MVGAEREKMVALLGILGREVFGREMQDAGRWSEYHQGKAKYEPMGRFREHHSYMGGWWDRRYQLMMKVYHGRG